LVSGRSWPEMGVVSNLRPLVVPWLGNIMLATCFLRGRARGATRRSTIAVAASPDGATAATNALPWRGARAFERRRANTTTASRRKGKRSIVPRRLTDVRAALQNPWGITAARRNRWSYKYLPRRRLVPSRRPSMPLSPTLLRRQWLRRPRWATVREGPIASSGYWWRGQSYSRLPVDDRAPRRAVPFADDRDASSRSSLSSSGESVPDAVWARGIDV
jgi:hypothetical protein